VSTENTKLSTTALARKLDIPAQQLFAILKDYGWIHRAGDNWVLTPKGEFEGGSVQFSRRYGSYIVWPEHLDQHPLLQAIESNQRISAATMCRYYPHLNTRQINLSLAEMGLQRHCLLGWELTPKGRALGGLQEESRSSGAFFVTWPHEIIDNPIVHRELSLQSEQLLSTLANGTSDPDLFSFSDSGKQSSRGIDGHTLPSVLQMHVCNWLYFAQVAHAIQRALPTEEIIHADFYIPAVSAYIDCWEAEVPAGELSGKFRKRELYRELDLRHLEVNAADIDHLDEVLGRGLLSLGLLL
jgi:hypothetical protein